jgi:superfamily II RNA helicase
MNAMIANLEEKQQLPALFFVFSRKDCQRYADLTEHTLIDSSDAAAVRHIMDFHLHSYGDQLQRIPEYHTIRALLEKGIAYHHSGVIPILKECIEILFARGLVKVLFATETFAVGINMPTKTVVFTGFRKYDDTADRMRILNTDEYIQMAGRAGRRGKDERGYIVYLPDREPETIETIRAMMTGRSSTFQSRMKFDYEFILKTFQAGTLRWMDLLQSSYWNIGHTKECRESQEEIDKERAIIESVDLSEVERSEMAEHKSIQENLRSAVNAARRVEQRRLEVWNNRHMGPRWYKIIHEIWPKYQRAIERVQLMEEELAEKCDPTKFITPNLSALRYFGFLEDGPQDKLTPIGVMATEVNEGHTILMPLAYTDPNIRSLLKTKEDIITFLAIFLGEHGDYNGLEVSGAVRASLRILKDIAITCQEKERRSGASSPYNYWELNADFVEIIWRFVNGEEPGILLRDYELFGGNLTRLISKMVNILREWTTLATLSSDTETLTILSDAEKLLEIGTMGSESLYLRLA